MPETAIAILTGTVLGVLALIAMAIVAAVTAKIIQYRREKNDHS